MQGVPGVLAVRRERTNQTPERTEQVAGRFRSARDAAPFDPMRTNHALERGDIVAMGPLIADPFALCGRTHQGSADAAGRAAGTSPERLFMP